MYLAFTWHATIVSSIYFLDYTCDTTSKSCRNINFKILTNLETSSQSPDKNLTLWPKSIFQICTKLLSTRFSSSTSTPVTTSTSFELLSSHARVTSIKFTKREWVSEWVSQSVSDKHSKTVTTSFELPSSHARITSIKFTKQESVSVSEWVS